MKRVLYTREGQDEMMVRTVPGEKVSLGICQSFMGHNGGCIYLTKAQVAALRELLNEEENDDERKD